MDESLQWLVDFWNTYKNTILPILLTLLSGVLSFVIIYVRTIIVNLLTKLTTGGKMSEATHTKILEMYDKVADKDTVMNLGSQVQTIMKDAQGAKEREELLAEMIMTAFNNSGLNPETKLQIDALYQKIRYGNDTGLVTVLESSLKLAEEKIASLEKQLQTPEQIKVVEEPEVKPVERVRT